MVDPVTLIKKHRGRGVLLDANLLIVLLVGTVNRFRIAKFNRTSQYSPEDFDLLVQLVYKGFGGNIIVTPHVLSQASDLAALPGEEFLASRSVFQALVIKSQEIYDLSKDLVANPVFTMLGLADAAVAAVCSRGTLIMTDDRALHGALEKRGSDSLYFPDLRYIRSRLQGHGAY
jgi:hypothetical protein